MPPNIIKSADSRNRRGFTLIEIMIASIIGMLVIAATWSVYMMISQWWSEMNPRIEALRAARMALLSITEGSPDSTTGTYIVYSKTYRRRNGIAWATAYPTISSDGKTISYRLEPDSSNVRQFYIGTYNGEKYIYYRDGNNVSHRLNATRGVSDIKFETLVDADGDIHPNIIKVTVTVAKTVSVGRSQPLGINIVYADTVYLRNAL